MKRSLAFGAAMALLAACVPAPMPFPQPPPLPAETLPLPPVSQDRLMWQPGDWTYAAGSYRYEPGQYVAAAGHSRNWMFGHWELSGPPTPQPVWQPGHWL